MHRINKFILPYGLISIWLLAMVMLGWLPWYASIPAWPLMGLGGIAVSKGISDLFSYDTPK